MKIFTWFWNYIYDENWQVNNLKLIIRFKMWQVTENNEKFGNVFLEIIYERRFFLRFPLKSEPNHTLKFYWEYRFGNFEAFWNSFDLIFVSILKQCWSEKLCFLVVLSVITFFKHFVTILFVCLELESVEIA